MIAVGLLFLLGLVMICLGGDKLVDAAVSISTTIGIPQIVVGATIVSFCTTMPEMLVSTTAILNGSAAISVGNAYGSIICNTGLIAGLALLIRPARQGAIRSILWRCIFFFLVAVGLLWVGVTWGNFRLPVGLALLLLFAVYALLSILFSKGEEDEEEDAPTAEGVSMGRNVLTLALCALLLFFGANLLVDNGTLLAAYFGVPERVIAVTAIALGTSLPELVTTIVSLMKRHANIGIGNVIGANILNLLLVVGIPSTFSTIALEQETLYMDMPLAILVMVLLALPIFVWKKTSRVQGALLLAIYIAYCAIAL